MKKAIIFEQNENNRTYGIAFFKHATARETWEEHIFINEDDKHTTNHNTTALIEHVKRLKAAGYKAKYKLI